MKTFCLLSLIIFSNFVYAQNDQQIDVDAKAMIARERRKSEAYSNLLRISPDHSVFIQIRDLCEKVVFSNKKDNDSKVDILSPIDVSLCQEDLAINLNRFLRQ